MRRRSRKRSRSLRVRGGIYGKEGTRVAGRGREPDALSPDSLICLRHVTVAFTYYLLTPFRGSMTLSRLSLLVGDDNGAAAH